MKNPRLNTTVQQGDIDMLNAIKDTPISKGGAASYSSAIRKALRLYCKENKIGYVVTVYSPDASGAYLPIDTSTEDEDDESW